MNEIKIIIIRTQELKILEENTWHNSVNEMDKFPGS